MIAMLLLLACAIVRADVALPRGVSMAKASLYAASDTFTCFDGSDTISFQYINDDYCDCDDGSDEPGTAACAGGHFYCANRGHAAQEVPSAWVNDGVCDCCDGSDEYVTGACVNTCEELGAETRVRQQTLSEMRLRGYEVKLKLIEEGKQKLTERQARMTELTREKEVATGIKEQREAAKNTAEEQERLLLDAWQEARRAQEQEREAADRLEAEQTFARLDGDGDGRVTAEELQLETRLDKDGDGAVSRDEVDSITMNKDQLEQDEFVSSVWPLLKTMLHPEATTAESTSVPSDPDQHDEQDDDDDDEGLLTEDSYEPPEDEETDSDEEEDDHEDFDPERHRKFGRRPTEPASEPEYDEPTQAAVDAAKEARAELSEAERKLRDIEQEMTGVEAFIGFDLGPDRQFAALYRQCFSLENREYEYTLCMFDRASQKPRNGGIDTSLGKWGLWESPHDNNYSQQLYENGQQCWNGPKRSAHVTLSCGEETRLLDVTEPAKCEYRYVMETPAVCTPAPAPHAEQLYHDEL